MQKSCANDTCSGKPFRKIGGSGDYYCSGCVTYYKNNRVIPTRKNCLGCGMLLQQRVADRSDYCKKCSEGLPCQAIVGGKPCIGKRGTYTGNYCYTHQRDSIESLPFREVTHQGGKGGGCYRHGNPSPCDICVTDRRLIRVYGITYDQFLSMLEDQDGKCAFPQCTTSLDSKKLFVDHDHKTGSVRSLICYRHNFLLGHAQDDIQQLKHAISYLEKHTIQEGAGYG